MNLTPKDIALEVGATGFPGDTLEKVFRLMSLLNALNSHPFLRQKVALKGGTATNIFLLNVPRLSVDIDLNYLGSADRETMLADRPRVEQAVHAVCSREDLRIKRMPLEHAGGKWRLAYTASSGESGNLELDVNFMLRTPLWPPVWVECRPLGSFRTKPVYILDPHELAAGKLAALLVRSASRDIFDTKGLLASPDLDNAKIRLAFVVYGGINRKDWRTVSPRDVQGEPTEIQRDLVPMLRSDLAPDRGDTAAWSEKLVADCRQSLSAVLPLASNELEFLDRLNDRGVIAPELLTADPVMQGTIRKHPALCWKAMNVREHHGIPDDD